jgi:hypothetical protein
MLFRVGTCHGQWRATNDAYEILSIVNTHIGNGHFDDVLQWFEDSCQRDRKILRIREVWNGNFKAHLIRKRGFSKDGADDVVKTMAD